ncbi:dTDP-4-dehydrorhamnose reductase [Ascidiimonas sp. W6]|uniref:dTDP-4-dehydrorhamnose reductase n=1 Tax=Ascidiimonas meishanensis TaxID=3128903 RepID=UPI0030EE1065
MKIPNKQILVTGSDGQLGKSLQDIASDFSSYDFIFTTKKELDITDKDEVTSFLRGHKIAYCINCAAYTKVDQAEQEPEKALEINAEAVNNLAQLCKRFEIVLIHISTDYVFDGTKKTPYTVQDSANPINVYGKSKLLGESYIQEQMQRYFIIRTSWLYHKKHGNNFYKTILRKAQNAEDLKVTSAQIGCPTNAGNLAKFIMTLILENKNFGIYHFSDKEPMTWYQFAERILKEHKLQDTIHLTKQEFKTLAPRPAYSVLE